MSLKIQSKRLGSKLVAVVAVTAFALQPLYSLAASQVAHAESAVVTTQAELEAKLLDTSIDSITLGSDIHVDTQINVRRNVTIEGNGKTLSRSAPKVNGSNNAVLGLQSPATHIRVLNLTVDAMRGTDLHAVNIWKTDAYLYSVTAKNAADGNSFFTYGVVVNGSTVRVDNLKTVDNDGGVDVDKGSALTVGGASSHTENLAIYRENTGTDSTVDDTNGQYRTVDVAGRQYTLLAAPNVPVLTSPAANTTVGSRTLAITWNASAPDTTKQAVDRYYTDVYHVGGSLVAPCSYQPVAATATSFTCAVDADGQYDVRVYAETKTGQRGISDIHRFTVDATAPTVPVITTPTANQEFDSSVRSITAAWNASTDPSGVKQYEISYDYTRSGARVTDTRLVSSTSRKQSLSGTTLSDFVIKVRAQDMLGNWSDWSQPVTYYYGVKAPVTEPEQPEGADNSGSTGGNTNGSSNQGGTPAGTNTPVAVVSAAQQFAALQPSAAPAQILAAAIAGNTDVLGVTDNTNDGIVSEVRGASDQAKTLASTATPDVLGASDNKLLGLLWYWWLLIAAAVIVVGWWIIAALRRRDGDDA